MASNSFCCCLLVVIGFSGFTDSATRANPNTTKIGSSEIPANKSLWIYDVRAYLMQMLPITEDGTLFAFSMVSRTVEPFDIMIWRPVTDNKTADYGLYTLIWKIKLSASILMSEEYVYTEAKLIDWCPTVRKDDWIGVYGTTEPFPIGFIFDKEKKASVFSAAWNKENAPDVSEQVNFFRANTQLEWPIQVLLSAYIIPDDSRQTENSLTTQCPSGLIVSQSLVSVPTTTTPQPITGVPGDTGPDGVTGQTGPHGLTGSPGYAGSEGSPGNITGSIGENGTIGPTGEIGVTGSEGGPGYNGTEGLVGATGLTGKAGNVGDTGPSGLLGINITVHIDGNGKLLLNNTRDVTDLFWLESVAMTGIYIWLAILSGLFVIGLVLIIITCGVRKDMQSTFGLY